MNYDQAYAVHIAALKALSAAYGNEPNANRAQRIRAIIHRLRTELYQMIVRDLEASSAVYAVLTPGFNASAAELKWVSNQAAQFKASADQIAALVGWAAAFLPLL